MRHDHYVLIILQIEGHPDLISWIIEEPEEPIGQLGARWIDADPFTVGHGLAPAWYPTKIPTA